MGDGLIRAWELHRSATLTRTPSHTFSRIILLFTGGLPSRGLECGDGGFQIAVELISRRIREGNFGGASSNNLGPHSDSPFEKSIFIYSISVSLQVNTHIKRFLRCVEILQPLCLNCIPVQSRQIYEDPNGQHQYRNFKICKISLQLLQENCVQQNKLQPTHQCVIYLECICHGKISFQHVICQNS